jgi:hypothetical protein
MIATKIQLGFELIIFASDKQIFHKFYINLASYIISLLIKLKLNFNLISIKF